MRSVSEDQWVDEIVYTKLFDNATEQDSFIPTPPMNSTIVGTGGAVVEAKLISVVVSLERKMEVLDATMHWGIEVAEDTTDTIEKAGEVAVDVVDQAGSTLASVSPPDGVSVSPAKGESREVPHVPFVLPHPEGTYEVRVEYQEETTGFYPVTATLRHTVGRVPVAVSRTTPELAGQPLVSGSPPLRTRLIAETSQILGRHWRRSKRLRTNTFATSMMAPLTSIPVVK